MPDHFKVTPRSVISLRSTCIIRFTISLHNEPIANPTYLNVIPFLDAQRQRCLKPGKPKLLTYLPVGTFYETDFALRLPVMVISLSA